MSSTARRHPKRADFPDKTLKVHLYFWTNNIAGKNRIVPKHAWDSGTFMIEKNDAHGIEASYYNFASMSELQPAIEKAFKKIGVKLHHSTKYRTVYD